MDLPLAPVDLEQHFLPDQLAPGVITPASGVEKTLLISGPNRPTGSVKAL